MSSMRQLDPLDEMPRAPRSTLGPRLVLGLVLLAAAGAAFWWWRQSRETPAVAPPVESKPVTQPPAAPPTASMAEGDGLLRQLGARLSNASQLPKWLAEADIVRRLVAAVNLIAEGSSPRPVLGFLGPAGEFEVMKRKGKKPLRASPRSYARYDAVTQVVASIDATAAAKVYGQMKPYLDSAFAEVGRPGKSFDGVLRAAMAKISATPIPLTEPALEPKGLGYGYVDPKLEELSPAQKHLLRMGPNNARAIQAWLKKFEDAIGKPSP